MTGGLDLAFNKIVFLTIICLVALACFIYPLSGYKMVGDSLII